MTAISVDTAEGGSGQLPPERRSITCRRAIMALMHALWWLPRPVQALALSGLLLAVVLAGVVRAAGAAERFCGGQHCGVAILALVTPAPERSTQSGHDPCTGDPGCGSGASLALCALLLVAVAGSQLVGWRPGPTGRVRSSVRRLHPARLVWRLERPPRLPA